MTADKFGVRAWIAKLIRCHSFTSIRNFIWIRMQQVVRGYRWELLHLFKGYEHYTSVPFSDIQEATTTTTKNTANLCKHGMIFKRWCVWNILHLPIALLLCAHFVIWSLADAADTRVCHFLSPDPVDSILSPDCQSTVRISKHCEFYDVHVAAFHMPLLSVCLNLTKNCRICF